MKAKGQSEAFGGIEKSLREKEKKHRKQSTGIGGRGGGVPVKGKGQNKQSQAKGGRGMPNRSLGGKKIRQYDNPQCSYRQPALQWCEYPSARAGWVTLRLWLCRMPTDCIGVEPSDRCSWAEGDAPPTAQYGTSTVPY